MGLGTEIIRVLTSKFDFLFGKSVTAEALAVYQKFGFRYLPATRWLMIAEPDVAFQLCIEPTTRTLKRLRERESSSLSGTIKYRVSLTLPDSSDTIIKESVGGGIRFARTERYLRWRYEDHPVFQYVFLTTGDPARSMAVLREEVEPGGRGVAHRVVEYFEPAGSTGLLAAALAHYARSRRAGFVDLIGVSEHYVAGVLTGGGFQQSEEPDIVLPYRLSPWVAHSAPPDLLFYANIKAAGGLRLHSDLTRIFVSKGDGNCDWPSWVPDGGHGVARPTSLASTSEDQA